MTFEEDPDFTEKALRMIGDDGIFAIQMYLMGQPDAGDIIPGSGGCRKLRWAAKGHGKRGGARVIYYWSPTTTASCFSTSTPRTNRRLSAKLS